MTISARRMGQSAESKRDNSDLKRAFIRETIRAVEEMAIFSTLSLIEGCHLMSRQSFLCPKCGKAIRRISMSGGSVVYQGLPAPDPDDFCITIHPCRCSTSKIETGFQNFVNVWKQAYNIPEFNPANGAVISKPLVAVAADAIRAASPR
jgi:hypothetical protein